jgi:hypothetical protein
MTAGTPQSTWSLHRIVAVGWRGPSSASKGMIG